MNGTLSGNADLLGMMLVFSNLPSCLPLLAVGLVPAGHHYYEGSDSLAEHRSLLLTRVSLLIAIEFPIIPSPTTT